MNLTGRSETVRCLLCQMRVAIVRDALGACWKESPQRERHDCPVLADELTHMDPPHVCLCGGLIQSDIWGHRHGWLVDDEIDHDDCRHHDAEWVDAKPSSIAVVSQPNSPAKTLTPTPCPYPVQESSNGFRVVPW